MSSIENNTLTAWAGVGKGKPLQEMQLAMRAWDENCIEINITHCGMCGSDIHTLDENWGPTDYPCVVGHEIVGVVTRIGNNVSHLKVGDRAGIGAQCSSCHKCQHCTEGNENLCVNSFITTYNHKWENGDKTYGGYADKWRGDCRFAFKVPDSMTSEIACTFFCGGVTTYAPLKRTGVNENSIVGVMGLGGLGHYGVLWAKAMGATVVGISHSDKKREVAKELGCDDYINSSDDESMAKYKKKFTHILCTGTSPDFQWPKYLALVKGNSHFVNVSAPDWPFPAIDNGTMITSQVYVSGSAIGSPTEIEEMLQFATEKNVKPWITKYPMSEVNKAIKDFREGKPRFRFVLEN